jgi:hypothetical protein
MQAARDVINEEGGVTLADGSTAKIEVEFYDDRCNAEEGISVVRRIASDDYLTAIGPTCSNVAEPLYGILQARVDDDSDTGLQFPLFTDVAIKGGLARSPTGRSATCRARRRCTTICSPGSRSSIPSSRRSMAASRRTSPIPAPPGTRS